MRDNLMMVLDPVKALLQTVGAMKAGSRSVVTRWSAKGCWMLLCSVVLFGTATISSAEGERGRARWVDIGPAPIVGGQVGLRGHERPVTGRVADVAVDPSDGRHWLVGGAQGGVWETTDGGRSWSPLTDDQESLAMGAIAFAPDNPLVVYAGTGEAVAQKGAFPGFGLLKLSRQTASAPWAVTRVFDDFAGLRFSDIKAHGDGGPGERLVVATRWSREDFYGLLPETDKSRRGVLEYRDNKWEQCLQGEATDLEVHPKDFDRMYAGITYVEREPGMATAGVYRRGIPVAVSPTPRSARITWPIQCPAIQKKCELPANPDDGSGPWHRITGPWDEAACHAACAMGKPELWPSFLARIELAIGGREHPDVLYVSIARRYVPTVPGAPETNDSRLLGLWRTSNAWSDTPEWIKIPVEQTDGGSGDFGYCGTHPATPQGPLCHWSHEIIVDPNRPNVLYAGGIGLWKAEIRCRHKSDADCRPGPDEDWDVRWTEVSQTAPGNTATPRLRRRGIHVDQHAMAWDPAGARLIVGNDGGVWSTTDGGQSWADHNTGLSLVQFYRGAVADSPDGSGIVVLGGTQDNGIVRWDGSRWVWMLGGDGGAVALSHVKPMMRAAVATSSVLFGDRIRRTVDGGKEFTFADAATPPKATDGNTQLIKVNPLFTSLAICPQDDDVLLTHHGELWITRTFFSSPATPSWLRAFKHAKAGTVTAAAFGPSEHPCARFAFGTNPGQGFENHVYLTTNEGRAWCQLKGLPLPVGSRITGLAFDASERRTLYATAVNVFEAPTEFGLVVMTRSAPTSTAECPDGTVDPGWTSVRLPTMVPVSAARCHDNACTVRHDAGQACDRFDAAARSRPADWREQVNTVAVHPVTRDVYVGTNAGIWRRTLGSAAWERHDCAYGMPNVPVFDIKITPKGHVVAFTYGRGAFLWQEHGWCDGARSSPVGTNFRSCASQERVRARRVIPTNDVLSAP